MTRADLFGRAILERGDGPQPTDGRVASARQRIERAIAARDAAKRAGGISKKNMRTRRRCSNKATFKARCVCWRWRKLDPQHPRTILL
jgi:hypothetical protein